MTLRLAALSGSLRKASYNTALLHALKILAPPTIEIIVFGRVDALPLFNPDRESEDISVVSELKGLVGNCQGLIISSPEYAHGISGVMKNTLDWLVSGPEFINLPIALYNTSPRANHAQAALREVLTTMSAKVIEQASVKLPLLGSALDTCGIIEDETMALVLRESLTAFSQHILRSEATRFD